MNRLPFSLLGLVGALTPLMIDSALKGVALLVAAALFALALWRASAAARHLVWCVAVVALLVVPILSVALPQWRVLPARKSSAPDGALSRAPDRTYATYETHGPHGAARPREVPLPSGTASRTAPLLASPEAAAPVPAPLPAAPRVPWPWIPLVWLTGFSLLALRLVAAHFLLRRAVRRCATPSPDSPLAAAVAACRAEIGVRQRVTLLVDDRRTIPVVWGVLRARLLLPSEARVWGDEQLRAVLLHELAHLKRRDPLVQGLAQVACALHWWNPLVWLAAWRLHVERERACDDLVLARGVRPSAYAEHLLHIATKLAPARWTQGCGLAMARKSSLEGRLVAVLSEKLNRRGVTTAVASAALVLGAAIAIPVAMLHAEEEPKADGATKANTEAEPRHEYAQSLFRKWQKRARTDGKIPGALIGHVARELENFIAHQPDSEESKQLAALRPRFDASRDWTQAEAVGLLDDITAIATAPVSWADLPMEFDDFRTIKPGEPLPAELEGAAWGEPAANGLRAAWLLEPRAEEYALGSVLKARVLFHNAGPEPVVFRTETWHQYDSHTARDAKDAEIKIGGTRYTGITPTATFRLGPHEYCEVIGHGIAIGAGEYLEEFSTGSVGAVIEAKVGDAVRLSHSVDTADGGWTQPDDPKDPVELWKKTIAERVANEAPLPSDAADREQLIRRVTLDLFGESPTAAEIAAFIGDPAPDALDHLVARLQEKGPTEPWTGKLPTGETKFRVLPADPDAAKKPRTANAPGRYVLGENTNLLVSQTTTDVARTNKAVIAFLSPDPKVASPFKPHEIALPDGLASYAIAWERGAGELWISQKGLVRKYDFANPDQVQEMRFEPGSIDNVPEQFRDALKGALDEGGETPKTGAADRPSPKGKAAKELFDKWQDDIDANGMIPGTALTPLVRTMEGFLKREPNSERAQKLIAILSRIDMTRAWNPEEVAALLDEVTGISDQLVEWASIAAPPEAEDWAKRFRETGGWDYNPGEPFDPEELARLSKTPLASIRNAQDRRDAARRMSWLICRAGAEKDMRFRYLLADPEFQKDKDIALALAGYDYSVNGNLEALNSILEHLAKETPGSDAQALVPLGFIDEWDLSITAFQRHFASGTDGAGGISRGLFWMARECLFPQNFQRHQPWKHGNVGTDETIPASQAPAESKPTSGIEIQAGVDATLKWGEPVNGLRAAVAIRPATHDPKAGDLPDLFVAVQNVSEEPIRLDDSLAEEQPRMLYLKIDGRTQMGIGAKEPRFGEVTLQPHEVAFVPMYALEPANEDGSSSGALIGEGLREDPRQSAVVHLIIEKAPEGAWTGKLVTGETNGAEAMGQVLPKDKAAQSLFRTWHERARANGMIPGGMLGPLARVADNFVRLNPTDERAPKLAELRKRIDTSHDWTPAAAAALLDDVTAIYDSLPQWVQDEGRFTLRGPLRLGEPLPAELADAPWGPAASNGLRVAWLLDPQAKEYPLNTPLKSRILFNNTGPVNVIFPALTWNQSGAHKALDAKGTEIPTTSTEWTTIPQVIACRLAPGEFLEVIGAGIGVGANMDEEDWRGTRVGTWIDAKEGDVVTFTPAPVTVTGNFTNEQAEGDPAWWRDFILEQLSLELPLSDDPAEVKRSLTRLVGVLFGGAPRPKQIEAFVAHQTPEALAEILTRYPGVSLFTGHLQSGETTFRVLPVDPDAAKKPRTATGPGRYTLGENVRLVVTRRSEGDRIVNEADLTYFPPGADNLPHAVNLSDGYDTWTAAWRRDGSTLWVRGSDGVTAYDFSNPAAITETTPATDQVPAEIREALAPPADPPASGR